MSPREARPAPTTALDARLGLNVHRDRWPTTPQLKEIEAAGFSWVQVHAPPRPMLCDRAAAGRHARALRAALAPTGLRLLLHGPDDLRLGRLEHDRAFDGLLDHAVLAGAELVVYHGLGFPDVDGPAGERVRRDLDLELRSLARLGRRAHALGATIAVENLAPVHPRTPWVSDDPYAVHDAVRRLALPGVGMLLDLGHAHITCALNGRTIEDVLRRVLDEVVLFHVHDNLGGRPHELGHPGVDPLRLDLHLAPGSGTLPWHGVRDLLGGHRAPLVLEVEPWHRPPLVTLAHRTRALLGRDDARVAA